MVGRPPSSPPQIPGFTYERLLGSGGFADVFLYSQDLPRRQVAVKVLLEGTADEAGRRQFVAEANVMAQLSTHPSIVTIYHADTAGDGRPYLVMEYCPRPNLSARYRTAPLPVAEAIRIGIRLAGAVETAHRAGILHRDIKPANVLTTDYGWPALTDFGISVVTSAGHQDEAVGMSIPWSAPEFFDPRAERGVAADIYSLAATVYTLLAGRSPHQQAAGRNSALDLIARIERDPVPPLGRSDAPAALQEVLQRGMAKAPGERHATAAEFARALQRVEQELHLTQTGLDVPDTSWIQEPDAADDRRTRVRSVVEISPAAQPPGSPHRPPAAPQPALPDHTRDQDDGTRLAAPAVVPADPTPQQPHPPAAGIPDRSRSPADDRSPQQAGTDPARRRRRLTLVASAAVVAVVGGVVVYGAINAPDDAPAEPTTPVAATAPATDPPASRPDPPADLSGQRDPDEPGTVSFTWSPPDYDGDLEYAWRQRAASETETERISSTDITLTDHPDQVCVEVAAISAQTNRLSEWSEACA